MVAHVVGLVGSSQHVSAGWGWRKTAAWNYSYLHTKTFYRSERRFNQALAPRFQTVVFAHAQMIRHSYGKARLLAPIARIVAPLYGACHQRCLFLQK